jgi:hypothetical protein
MAEDGDGRRPRAWAPRTSGLYTLLVGMAFIALIAVAGINALTSRHGGALKPADAGEPLPEFAVPDARSELTGDANIAQDDCSVSAIPCPSSERRIPACEIEVNGAIRVCDLFDQPLVLSFWFTRGTDCATTEDTFEAVYRQFRRRANFLSIDVRDSRDEVRNLIAQHGWTHPVGLDSDGALSNLYRIAVCPTYLYVYPGGVLENVTLGELDRPHLAARVRALLVASRQRERTRR